LQTQEDNEAIEGLIGEVFDPHQQTWSVWNLRRCLPISSLCLVSSENGCLVGSFRFLEVFLGREKLLLLGPLAVQPSLSGKEFGQQLVYEGIQLVPHGPWRFIWVSGEPDYYLKFGFVSGAEYRIDWPSYIEMERLQFYELVGGSLSDLQKIGLALRGIAPKD